MAFNKVMLAGIVQREPEYLFNRGENGALQARLEINRQDLNKKELISVLFTEDNVLNQAMNEVREGDYLFVSDGRLVTTNYKKVSEVVCPHCQEVEYQTTSSERTEIVVKDFSVIHREDCNQLDALPGINKVFLLGNVCSDLYFRPGEKNGNKEYVKYKLAVDRPGHFTEEQQSGDYPFIVSFHKDATISSRLIHKGDLVFVEGAIQQRIIHQKAHVDCESCHQMAEIRLTSIVREIITSRVEIMRHYSKAGFSELPKSE